MTRVLASERLPEGLRGAYVALGNFDGFHLGHQAVARAALDRARAAGRPCLIATFDPHPIRYFKPDSAPFHLTSLAQRERLFNAAGADAMLIFDFAGGLAEASPTGFIDDWLIDRIGAAGVVSGDDFSFGKDRAGNVAFLRQHGTAHGLTVETVPPVERDGQIVSSTRVRQALRDGDMATAARLLTRPFAIEGVVEHGAKLGRQLGYPTANLSLGDYLRPRYGIYAVRATLADGHRLDGVANLGIRPTLDPPIELLEPFFFDFAGDLYGQRIEVELIEWLRGEERFDSLDALKAQMARDADAARAMLT